jgi:hypothetical protein
MIPTLRAGHGLNERRRVHTPGKQYGGPVDGGRHSG